MMHVGTEGEGEVRVKWEMEGTKKRERGESSAAALATLAVNFMPLVLLF